MFSFPLSILIDNRRHMAQPLKTPQLCSATTTMIKSFSSLAMHNAIQHHIIYTLFDLIFNVFVSTLRLQTTKRYSTSHVT